jgi:hypothetical protein
MVKSIVTAKSTATVCPTFYVCDGLHFDSRDDVRDYDPHGHHVVYGPYTRGGNYPKDCETSPEYYAILGTGRKFDTRKEAERAFRSGVRIQISRERMSIEGHVRGPFSRKYEKTEDPN